MKPSEIQEYLIFCMENRFPALITSKPGCGKSDIIINSARRLGQNIIISHPVVSDPTDYKGLPFPTKKGVADFLPFGDLHQLIVAQEPTVFFLDDLGQAAPAVQAACMQLILTRRINGHVINDQVTFIAASNRRQDKAGVRGILEPVKSRFVSIVELTVDTDDWVKWAIQHNMPTELIAFARFKPSMLDEFNPTQDLVNYPSPRTFANVGKQQLAGLVEKLEFEVFKGAAREAFATEYRTFLKIYRELPSVDQIILSPGTAIMPDDPGAQYAISAALARKLSDSNIKSIITYLKRLPDEIGVACIKDGVTRSPEVAHTREFIEWSTEKSDLMI
ncbi:ATP-binding protein [Pseudoflavitalea rhizosphaerae]|uniref:ATP-binding protein n=1 Tax=Pseudoflavitalea rhizosphaerae TaxID=1884793 RepID=UPI000F8F133B|nr:ATP-binding protein [Pseudoflavitalea rhizosphaerae]